MQNSRSWHHMVDGARAVETKEKNDENIVMPGMGQRWFYCGIDNVFSLPKISLTHWDIFGFSYDFKAN